MNTRGLIVAFAIFNFAQASDFFKELFGKDDGSESGQLWDKSIEKKGEDSDNNADASGDAQ